MIRAFCPTAGRYDIRLLLAAALATVWSPVVFAKDAAATHMLRKAIPMTGSGSCTFRKTEYAAASSFEESTSQDFINLKEAGAITFKQGGVGCVAGTFFANAGSIGGEHIGLQVLLDGIPCAPLSPGYIFADSEFSAHSVAFFCGAGIAAGKHTIQVQYRSGFGGNVQFFQRTLEVNHG